jgi:hypothetical protein
MNWLCESRSEDYAPTQAARFIRTDAGRSALLTDLSLGAEPKSRDPALSD